MSYEILPKSRGRKFSICKYNANSAVGENPLDRDIFEKIFQRSKVDYYICPNCKYYCIGTEYNILLSSMEQIEKDEKKLFITTPTNERLYLTKSNFIIVCECEKCINPDAWVKRYEPKKH